MSNLWRERDHMRKGGGLRPLYCWQEEPEPDRYVECSECGEDSEELAENMPRGQWRVCAACLGKMGDRRQDAYHRILHKWWRQANRRYADAGGQAETRFPRERNESDANH